MEELTDMIQEFQAIGQSTAEIIERVLRENEITVCEYVSVTQQFERGQDGLGRSLGSYRPYTIEIKQMKNQPTDRITLEDTGAFHRGFYIDFYPDGFSIRSTASQKGDIDLIEHWEEDIMDINDENMTDLMENYVMPEIIKAFEQ